MVDNLSFDRTWPPLWSSGQTSWLQSLRSGFDSRRCQIFWNGVHSASRVQGRSYLKEKVVAPVWKTEITALGDPQQLALTSPTSGTLGRYSLFED
jgi:hypothetical protein